VLADPHAAVPTLIRGTMTLLVEEIRLLELRIAQLERELTALARQSPACTTLLSIPGVGLLTATAMVGGNLRGVQPLPRCSSLRLLVRPHAQGTFLRRYPSSRAHLQTRRSLPAHA